MDYNKARQLKLVREVRGYTQAGLCNKIEGLSQANLSRFEKGFTNYISEDKLKNIMMFLEWPYEFLNKTINISLK